MPFRAIPRRDDRLVAAAWRRLLLAYLLAFAASFAAGIILIALAGVSPQAIYLVASKRVSGVLPLIESGIEAGIDPGLVIFLWNVLAALATISFLYAATLFDPGRLDRFPRGLRQVFHGRQRMRIFCFLPGCRAIDEEPLRRLFVWLMVPLLGIVLLGLETGLAVSTSIFIFDSVAVALASVLPHGVIEIPALALAGAVSYSGHLLLRQELAAGRAGQVFAALDNHRRGMPIALMALTVIFCLLAAGLIEGRLTGRIMDLVG